MLTCAFIEWQIHGILNTVSWGVLFPLGVIVARYMRTFPSADPAWFYLHVGCQVSAYAIGVAGWGTGMKLGSESVGIQYRSHRYIGIALFCFATLQVKKHPIFFDYNPTYTEKIVYALPGQKGLH